MLLMAVVLGFFVGTALGQSSGAALGAALGALVGWLLGRLKQMQKEQHELRQRIQVIERKQAAIPVAAVSQPTEQTTTPPAPRESMQAIKSMPPPRVSIHEPEAVVHKRAPKPTPSPGPLDHVIEVAKRWLTTGNVPVKVGIVISFFGVAFLLKYAVENSVIEIPVGMRYLGVAIFAAVLMGIGWRMRESQRVYALSLQGGGIGVLFLTVFAAFRLHDLLPPVIAFALLIVLTAAAGFLAVRQESRALAILGTTGGFLAPLLVSTGSGNHVALFSYYLVLNGAVLGVAWYRAWRELNIIGFVFTFGVGTLWGADGYSPEKFTSTEPFLLAHFLFYTAIAILFAFRSPPKLRGYVDGTLVFGTPTIAFALQALMLDDSEYGLAITAAVVAALYAGLAYWLRSRRDENFDLLRQSFTSLAVAFSTVAIPLALDDRFTAIAWALEGAALVWIGVRQNGTLARLSGVLLAFAGGAMYLDYGWVRDAGLPVLNGNVAGGFLLAVAAFTSARLLTRDGNRQVWHEPATWGLLIWGLIWWVGTGYMEIDDRLGGDTDLHAFLLFVTASVILMTFASIRLPWPQLRAPALTLLPILHLFAIAYLLGPDHFLTGFGVLAWPLAVAAHGGFLRAGKDGSGRLAAVWHGWGAVFFVALLAFELSWHIDQRVLNELWPFTGAMSVLGLASWLLASQQENARWPFSTNFQSYFVAALFISVAYMFFIVSMSVIEPVEPWPLPYIPILNPLDVLAAAGLVLTWFVLRQAIDREGWPVSIARNLSALWGASAFVLATLALVRLVHHTTDMPWDGDAMMNSTVLQTSLTIFWAALGLAGMLFGTKRANRRVWMIGVGLMAVVVLKLMVVDLSNTGTVARIVSFLGVGLMLLVVGYFSPVPPRLDDPDVATEH